MISLIIVLIKVQLVCQAHAVELRSPVPVGTIQHRKSDAICHAHCPDTGCITAITMDGISGCFLRQVFLVAILVVGLICSNFFQDGFQTTFNYIDLALVFSLVFFPIVFVSSPLLVYSIRILFLASNLLLCRLQPPFDFGVQIYSLVTFPRKF